MAITYPMAVITAPGKVEFQEKTFSRPGNEDVLIKTHAAAICGSDLHLFKGLHPSVPLPITVGHEAAGEVIEIGGSVTKHKIGDRVTVEPVIACGTCYFCERGEYNLCTNISFQYRKGQGAFSPYFVVNQNRAFRLPDNISYEEGALVEPLSVAMHAVKKSGLRLGNTSAVFGAGAIGLLVSMLSLQTSGVGSIICDINQYRLNKALELGARMAINSRKQDPVKAILEVTGQMGVDKTFEAVGMETTLTQSLQALKRGGSATLLGIFEQLDIKLPANLFIQHEISLLGSQGYSWDFQDGLSLLSTGRLDLKPLITNRIFLEHLQQGFEMLLDPVNESIKVVVLMDDQAIQI